MKQLGFFIILSLVLHFLASTSSLYFAEKFSRDKKKYEVTQIEIIDPQKNIPEENLKQKIEKARQLIKQLKTTVKNRDDSLNIARFESEKTQRVEKETKSKNLGLSQNSNFQAQQAASKPETNDGAQPEFARSKPNVQQMPVAPPSSINVELPGDISNSNATNLNTDANTYYSFYSRVEELFYVRWVERVRYYWDRISFDYKKNVLAGKVWVTTVEIWLTSTGEFHSAYLKQPSGYKPFDEAPIYAFKDARFFPNPPRAKIEPDGFVRLRYKFNIHVTD